MSHAAKGLVNRLASEPSPYLRQHAHNPVDWWPWGDAAFAEAKRRDVPIFLSIGYATCHWCHVMAHESFEDADVARAMNAAFVNVKVDREERPDVDDAYMAVCQMMTGSGGWPLTVLLTPDRKPFFAGTYFPKESRHGRMGMLDLVPRIQKAWTEQRKDLEAQADHLMLHLSGTPHGHDDEAARQPAPVAKSPNGDLDALAAGVAAFRRRFDEAHAGFGTRPKFPSPHQELFLLAQGHRGTADATRMATRTLHAMADGGLHDHVGGGFHRYSTDERWLLPHFEKMLYDQAMLALAYARAAHATREPRFAAVARSTLDYVLSDLSDPAGGVRCARDADSEGEEGRFYVWTHQELLQVLGPAAGARFAAAHGATPHGNALDEATRKPTGANVLHLPRPIAETAKQLGVDAAALESETRQALAKLRSHRARRVAPILDDKVLTDWNGLAVAALAVAGRTLPEPRYVDAARRVAGFLRTRMRNPDGTLRHRFHAGRTDSQSFLDDHAYLLWGLVELYEATFDPAHLAWARDVAGQLEARFLHPDGGFWHSPADGEDLGFRRREAYDGALPSGNSAAAYALAKLGLLTGEPRWTGLAERTVDAFRADWTQQPQAFAMMLLAVDLLHGPTQEVLVTGPAADPVCDRLVAAATRDAHPRRVVLRKVPGLDKVAPWTADYPDKVAAYVCEGFACKAPVSDVAGLERALGPTAATTP